MAITGSHDATSQDLTVTGDTAANTILVSRNAAGTLFVNYGTVPVTGTPTIANTDLIEVFGGDGNDAILLDESYGALPAVELFGGIGDDSITGGSGTDWLYGGAGDDTLTGKAGNDQMAGEQGDDWFYIADPGDIVSELANEGLDRVLAATAYTLAAGVHVEILSTANAVGTAAVDLTGNELANNVYGNFGDNSLSGGGGNDLLIGHDGDDTLDGGAGADTLNGGPGEDTLQGGAGDDVLVGGAGADAMSGGAGNDWYYVDDAADTVSEAPELVTDRIEDRVFARVNYTLAAGADVEILSTANALGTEAMDLTGNELANAVYGNFGDNVLRGGGGNDLLIGHDGNDTLNGGTGVDTMYGGAGNDWFYVDNAADVVSESLNEGTDRVVASVSYTLASDLSIEAVATNDASATTAINLRGNQFGQAITGNAGANVLSGGVSNDTLIALDGNDVLNGGGGNDTMTGGLGDDTYYMDSRGDVVNELPGEGTDTLAVGFSYTLAEGSPLDWLATIDPNATTAINLTGNSGANSITGNAGANVLNGGAGADTMAGLAGNDTYYVDTVSDVVSEKYDQGNDTVRTSGSYTLAAGLWIEELATNDASATTAINLGGNELNQRITGNAGANVLNGYGGNDTLDGGAGADTMAGGPGDDHYYMDSPGDVVNESADQGYDYVLTSVSYTVAAGLSIEALETNDYKGTTAINLGGNELDNDVLGNAGVNYLDGGAGNDVVVGQEGDDTLVGGAGDDRLIGGPGDDVSDGGAGNDEFWDDGGNDSMTGGLGDDRYFVMHPGVAVYETAGQGNDWITTNASYTLPAGLSIETLSAYTYWPEPQEPIDLTGNEIANVIEGNDRANVLRGGGGNDTLIGLGGNDTLDGGAGADLLTGSVGADSFVFADAGEVDSIVDYVIADDVIRLDDAVFTGLAVGALTAGAFGIGAAAAEADDRIIYNSVTGALLFDVDGVGGVAAVQFATLSTGLAMTAGEFVVI